MKSKNDMGSQLRSRRWFNDPDNPDVTALHLERYMNFGLTREELQSDRPIIGIAQTGSDLVPCNRHHLDLTPRIKDGIRQVGGIPLEFPVHPLQETGKRPTAALDRNLAYLVLVEILYGYPLDGVVLTTGCDKTTPACLMAAATVDIPAIVFSGGPMLNGRYGGRQIGSGTIIWEARKRLATREISYEECMEMIAAGSPSAGHCNTMGTALSMNCLAEGLGMSLPGCASIPAPYRERGQMAYRTGQQAVELVRIDLKPSDIMTRAAFENAIVLNSAIGGSTNTPIHLNAIAQHLDIDLNNDDWQSIGHRIPLMVDLQPAGKYLAEDFHEAGGVPRVIAELLTAAALPNPNATTVTTKSVLENYPAAGPEDNELIRRGITELPCIGDGRQSGTSGSPSILNAAPEAAAMGGLALAQTGDIIRVDLAKGSVNLLLADSELNARRTRLAADGGFAFPGHQTPWQEIQRGIVELLDKGMVLKPAVKYQHIAALKGLPRNNH